MRRRTKLQMIVKRGGELKRRKEREARIAEMQAREIREPWAKTTFRGYSRPIWREKEDDS